jgi:hypothetical protein
MGKAVVEDKIVIGARCRAVLTVVVIVPNVMIVFAGRISDT